MLNDASSIVLVGLCNNDPFFQIYLGNFHLDSKTGNPVIWQRLYSGIETCEVDYEAGYYIFDKWCNGRGLSIHKKTDNTWIFLTGLRGYDSGSSGLLINGGNQMEELYNRFVKNVN